MTRLNEKTEVPLVWLVSGMIFACGASATAALFFANINYRLERIEDRLSLPPYDAFTMERDSSASETSLSTTAQNKGE